MERNNASFMDIVCLGIGSCIYMYLLEEEERRRRERRNKAVCFIGSVFVGFMFLWFIRI